MLMFIIKQAKVLNMYSEPLNGYSEPLNIYSELLNRDLYNQKAIGYMWFNDFS